MLSFGLLELEIKLLDSALLEDTDVSDFFLLPETLNKLVLVEGASGACDDATLERGDVANSEGFEEVVGVFCKFALKNGALDMEVTGALFDDWVLRLEKRLEGCVDAACDCCIIVGKLVDLEAVEFSFT